MSDQPRKISRADLARMIFGHQEPAPDGACVSCREAVGPFRDQLSLAEHRVSGLCQKCQDETFGGSE